MRKVSLSLLLFLAACHRPDVSRNDESADSLVTPPSALERAALNAGVITDSAKVSVPGLYQRRQEAGVDTLCMTSGKDRRYAFGMEAIFGTEQYCRGEGTARRAGDKLILHFSGRSQCIIVAQYDGDRVASWRGRCEMRRSLHRQGIPGGRDFSTSAFWSRSKAAGVGP